MRPQVRILIVTNDWPGAVNGGFRFWREQGPSERTGPNSRQFHLGEFVSWCLSGLRESFVELKKGSAVLLEFSGEIKPGRARLLWALKPSHLRALGGERG